MDKSIKNFEGIAARGVILT